MIAGRPLNRVTVYLLVLLALSVPLLAKWSVTPARMESAEHTYELIEALSGKGAVLLAIDFGPNSMAENMPQAEVILEHLFRRRVPVLLISQYALAQPFLDQIPEKVAERLMKEQPEERWVYGKDWVNLGVKQVNARLTFQAIAESEDIGQFLKKDARGNSLADLPAFQQVRTLRDIPLFAQMTSLTGTFELYVQFLKRGDYRPQFVHGCTAITIPKAYIYLDSKQLSGLLEGVAGAAWYSTLLSRAHPARAKDDSLLINTGLGVAHLVIVALIVWGNIAGMFSRRRSSVREG